MTEFLQKTRTLVLKYKNKLVRPAQNKQIAGNTNAWLPAKRRE